MAKKDGSHGWVSAAGWAVSVCSSAGTHKLSVRRSGPKSTIQRRGDADGMFFESSDAAFRFASSRGYCQPYMPSRTSRKQRLDRISMFDMVHFKSPNSYGATPIVGSSVASYAKPGVRFFRNGIEFFLGA